MRSPTEPSSGLNEARPGALEAALDRLFGDGVRPLRLEEAIFEAMLDGWARQQRSRLLRETTINSGVRLVRRIATASERWPWDWTPADLEDFISDLASAPHHRRPATLRNYQSQLRGFLGYLADERYPWRLICAGCFGRAPVHPSGSRGRTSATLRPRRRVCEPATRRSLRRIVTASALSSTSAGCSRRPPPVG